MGQLPGKHNYQWESDGSFDGGYVRHGFFEGGFISCERIELHEIPLWITNWFQPHQQLERYSANRAQPLDPNWLFRKFNAAVRAPTEAYSANGVGPLDLKWLLRKLNWAVGAPTGAFSANWIRAAEPQLCLNPQTGNTHEVNLRSGASTEAYSANFHLLGPFQCWFPKVIPINGLFRKWHPFFPYSAKFPGEAPLTP